MALSHYACCAGHQWEEEEGGTFVPGGGLAWRILQCKRSKLWVGIGLLRF